MRIHFLIELVNLLRSLESIAGWLTVFQRWQWFYKETGGYSFSNTSDCSLQGNITQTFPAIMLQIKCHCQHQLISTLLWQNYVCPWIAGAVLQTSQRFVRGSQGKKKEGWYKAQYARNRTKHTRRTQSKRGRKTCDCKASCVNGSPNYSKCPQS